MEESLYYDIPICLFIFKRTETVCNIIDVLKKIRAQKIYVFSDGSREGNNEKDAVIAVRNLIDESINWNCKVIKEYSDTNLGCSANINRGFNKVLSENPYAIFLEDDVLPKEEFFYFCKEMLLKYQEERKVQYIGGFNAIGDIDVIKESYCFCKYGPMSGAIALWKDRWFSQLTIDEWNNKNNQGLVKEAALNREFRKKCFKEYNDAYNTKSCEWDVLLHFNLIIQQGFSIIPQRNLVSNCGYGEYGFHAQNKSEAKRFKKYMTASEEFQIYPLVHPDKLYWNISYEKIRQKIMLEIGGNWLVRHLRYIYLIIKNICYKYMPKTVWKFIKKMIIK